VSILHNPKDGRLYASASSASQEIVFAHDHQQALHLNFAKCSPIEKNENRLFGMAAMHAGFT